MPPRVQTANAPDLIRQALLRFQPDDIAATRHLAMLALFGLAQEHDDLWPVVQKAIAALGAQQPEGYDMLSE